jgi:hypothetical protein
MVLSRADLEELQQEYFADDVPITAEMFAWSGAAARAYFDSGGATLPSGPQAAAQPELLGAWEVVHTRVVVRNEPSTSTPAVGVKTKGEVVHAVGSDGDWIDVQEGWMLTDGKSVGLGQLLVQKAAAPTGGIAASSDDATTHFVAPVAYEVVHSRVYVRERPETGARQLGERRKGEVLLMSGSCGAWLKLCSGVAADDADRNGWMLSDGSALRLGALLRRHVSPLPDGTRWQACAPGRGRGVGARPLATRNARARAWQVTTPGSCVGYEQPGGVGEGGMQLADALPDKASAAVLAECGHWTQVRLPGEGATTWVPLDAFLAG